LALVWLNWIWGSPVIPWLVVAGTISLSLFLLARLRPLLIEPSGEARGGRQM
jgi:hypothetical protein